MDNLSFLVRELAQKVLDESASANIVDSPVKVFGHLLPWAQEQREHVICLYLNTRRELIGDPYVVSIGTLSASLVHPREVFREGIARGAASLVLAHNHPSGNPTPSNEDRALTRRLRQAGDILGIPVEDHLVFSAGSFVSLRERGEM